MKFKSDIEVQAGLRDGSNDIGTAGQLLSSTGTITNWINQSDVVAAGATRVLIACKNTSGGTIAKGAPVYQTGNVGATDVIEVAEADALISTGYLPAIGLLETDLINNAFGHVVITGELLNITTSPIDGVVPVTGDTIYLKSGGGLTLTKPTGEGNAIQNLGLVGKVSGGNAGSLTVASIMRQNDVPNLPEGRIWIGDGNTIVSDTVYVDEPNNRVGIGTTTPSTDLEVSSTGVNGVDISQSASNASQSGRLFFTTNTASEGFALFNSNGTFQVNSGGIPNNTSGTNRISIIGSTGNVGIGTTSPSFVLDVANGINDNDVFRINGANADVLFSGNVTAPTGGVGLWNFINTGTNATTRFYVQDANNSNDRLTFRFTGNNGSNEVLAGTSFGNVGIGTTSPTRKLHVLGPGNSTPNLAGGILLQTSGGGGLDIYATSTAANPVFNFRTFSGEEISFSPNSTELMRLKGSGVGIGTTSPSYKLDVSGEGRFTGDLRCLSLIQTSQRDQKENINDIDKSKAKAIPFKEYTYKSSIDGSSRKRYGVVVEDIEDDYPELVHTDADGVKGVNYIDLLVKRVAELEKELEDISLIEGPKGDTGAAGGDGKDGNSHLSNVTSIAFNPKANRLQVNIGGTVYNFAPSK